jgi:hypothetical protein
MLTQLGLLPTFSQFNNSSAANVYLMEANLRGLDG